MQMPMTPSSPLIIPPPLSPPSRLSSRLSQRMPSGPVSVAEATLTSIISLLVPLTIRLLLLSLLSTSSFFGHNNMHVYFPEPSQRFIFERLNDRYRKDNNNSFGKSQRCITIITIITIITSKSNLFEDCYCDGCGDDGK